MGDIMSCCIVLARTSHMAKPYISGVENCTLPQKQGLRIFAEKNPMVQEVLDKSLISYWEVESFYLLMGLALFRSFLIPNSL